MLGFAPLDAHVSESVAFATGKSKADPYARGFDWTDEGNVVSIISELQNLIRIQEIRAGKRSVDQFFDSVEVEET